MDIFTLKALVEALRPHIRGAVLSKAFQMSPHDLLLRLWRQQDKRLFLSIQGHAPRLHLTTVRFHNPQHPLRFAAFLRARLHQMRVADITVRPYDRVVSLHWEHPATAGQGLTLVHELYGQQSNIVLVDAAGMVLESLKPSPGGTTLPHRLMPGQPYQPLPQPAERFLLSHLTMATLEQLHAQQQLDAKGLQRLVIGLSSPLAAELIHRSQGQPQRCWTLLQDLRQQYDQGTLTLSLCTTAQGARHLSVLPLTHSSDTMTSYDGKAEEAVTAFYDPFLARTHLQDLQATLHKTIARHRQKLRNKMAHLARDYATLEQYLPYQHYGTLLLTQRVPRGTASITLVNYYSPTQESLTLSLDPRLSGQDNAQVYFKKYRKAKSGLGKIHALLAQCRTEEQVLDTFSQQIAQTEEWDTLETMATTLQQRYGAPRAKSPSPTPAVRSLPYRTFTLPEGHRLYCGKSDQGNETLLRQIASPDDIWLHAHQQAGAHVVLKVDPQQDVPLQTLRQAAALAAFYSKGKDAASVEVIYTHAKHVQKFRGARPGQVQVTEYRTLAVAPRLPEG